MQHAGTEFVQWCCLPYCGLQVFKNVVKRDANKIIHLLETPFFAGDTEGTHNFLARRFVPRVPQHGNHFPLRLALGRCHRLGVDVHRDTGRAMTQQFLHHLHVFAVRM